MGNESILDDLVNLVDINKYKAGAKRKKKPEGSAEKNLAALDDFFAYLPDHRYIYRATGDLWPAESLNGALYWPEIDGDPVKPSLWLDRNAPVQQMTWCPGEPEMIVGKLIVDGGTIEKKGARVYNTYRKPPAMTGDPDKAGPWMEHLVRVFGNDVEHMMLWFAQRLQHPEIKINHALVLGGGQGVGKDSLLAPIVAGVGQWNFSEITPTQMIGRFNGWVKSVILRVSEGRDLGEMDRFAFYDHSKTYIAAPPDVIRVDEKNKREYPAFNRMGVIITTNHKLDGIYLPPDDRRHFVAWTDAVKEDFSTDYWQRLWSWYDGGGVGHVVAYLRSLDLSAFDPKATPPRTEAFDAIVQSNHNPEELELADLLEELGHPDAITVKDLIREARVGAKHELADSMTGPRNARKVPHRMDGAGYAPMTNPGKTDGRWRQLGVWVTVYCQKRLTVSEQYAALRALGINA